MESTFVPVEFEVPESLITNQYQLEMLSPEIAELDYDAVMSSKNRLRTIFSERTEWPRDDMTLDENRKDLIRHQEEFETRKAFAYTVLNVDRNKCLGCVYIEPSRIFQFDCEIYLWVRESHISLDNNLFITINNWISDYWLFKKPAFPGREVSLEKWNLLLTK
jgi:hypothetical protein